MSPYPTTTPTPARPPACRENRGIGRVCDLNQGLCCGGLLPTLMGVGTEHGGSACALCSGLWGGVGSSPAAVACAAPGDGSMTVCSTVMHHRADTDLLVLEVGDILGLACSCALRQVPLPLLQSDRACCPRCNTCLLTRHACRQCLTLCTLLAGEVCQRQVRCAAPRLPHLWWHRQPVRPRPRFLLRWQQGECRPASILGDYPSLGHNAACASIGCRLGHSQPLLPCNRQLATIPTTSVQPSMHATVRLQCLACMERTSPLLPMWSP
jgi:hypothetical protein